ncbi:hypothetical protein F2Q70_00017037 [Brassica cretica]|uniref:DUF668 domain-containing protein n=2 Tax=Brassica TaxID=3705 RepID=A0A8S9I5I8_BRACR|nr:hypothetical protein F2Q70_00017037 [Brassica cretica]
MESSRLLKLSETTLGGSGVALHYANLIFIMEKMIKQPQLVGLNARNDLCSMLPATVRSSLSSRLKGVGFMANALHYAAELTSKGVPIDSQSESGTPLIWDAGHDILDHNVDPNAETKDNVTPLLSAVAAGSMACLELLVKTGAKANVFAGGATQLLISLPKQRGKAQKQKQEDKTHSIFPSTLTHKSYLLLKRSLCWLRLGQVEHALSDAKVCRELKPDWPKECFREGLVCYLRYRSDSRKHSNIVYANRRFYCLDDKGYCLDDKGRLYYFEPSSREWSFSYTYSPPCPYISARYERKKKRVFLAVRKGVFFTIYTCGGEKPMVYKLDESSDWEEINSTTLDGLTIFTSLYSYEMRVNLPWMRHSVYFPKVRLSNKCCVSYSFDEERYFPRKQWQEQEDLCPVENLWIRPPKKAIEYM